MNPDFIYFNKIALDDNNKFVLDFQMKNLYKRSILIKILIIILLA